MRLEGSEWFGVGAALALLISLFAFDWFAFTIDGTIAVGSEGDAFRWLGGEDILLLVAALVALGLPLLRYAGVLQASAQTAAVATTAAGLVAALVILYLVLEPPDGGADVFGPVGGDPGAGLSPRGGAVIGLGAALAIAAAGFVTVTHEPQRRAARARPKPHRRPAPARRLREPRESGALRRKLVARRPARAESPVSRPSLPAPTQERPPRSAPQPEAPAPSPREPPSPPPEPRPPRLADITLEELVVLGFTIRQAQRIVEYREQGLVTTVADLKRVPGIAKPVLAALSKQLAD